MTKQKSTVKHERTIFEYQYEFLDVLHVPTRSIIECKVASSDASLERHRKKIMEKWRTRRGTDYNDYYLICKSNETEFEVIDFLRIVNGRFTRVNFENFVCTA